MTLFLGLLWTYSRGFARTSFAYLLPVLCLFFGYPLPFACLIFGCSLAK